MRGLAGVPLVPGSLRTDAIERYWNDDTTPRTVGCMPRWRLGYNARPRLTHADCLPWPGWCQPRFTEYVSSLLRCSCQCNEPGGGCRQLAVLQLIRGSPLHLRPLAPFKGQSDAPDRLRPQERALKLASYIGGDGSCGSGTRAGHVRRLKPLPSRGGDRRMGRHSNGCAGWFYSDRLSS